MKPEGIDDNLKTDIIKKIPKMFQKCRWKQRYRRSSLSLSTDMYIFRFLLFPLNVDTILQGATIRSK